MYVGLLWLILILQLTNLNIVSVSMCLNMVLQCNIW